MIPFNPLRIAWHEAMQLMVIICLLGPVGGLIADAGTSQENLPEGFSDQSGHSSSIGYHSSYAMISSSSLSSRTEILSKGSQAASLHHSIQSAQEISGSSEYRISERSVQDGDSKWISSTTMGMKIDETVTEGKVSMGAFQADLSSRDEIGQIAGGKASKPWKDPALEMEEEYTGSFRISRNMTINSSYIIKRGAYSWLGYESAYLSFIPSKPISISADEVFNPK